MVEEVAEVQGDTQMGTMTIPKAMGRLSREVVTILQPIPTGMIILGLKVEVSVVPCMASHFSCSRLISDGFNPFDI